MIDVGTKSYVFFIKYKIVCHLNTDMKWRNAENIYIVGVNSNHLWTPSSRSQWLTGMNLTRESQFQLALIYLRAGYYNF